LQSKLGFYHNIFFRVSQSGTKSFIFKEALQEKSPNYGKSPNQLQTQGSATSKRPNVMHESSWQERLQPQCAPATKDDVTKKKEDSDMLFYYSMPQSRLKPQKPHLDELSIKDKFGLWSTFKNSAKFTTFQMEVSSSPLIEINQVQIFISGLSIEGLEEKNLDLYVTFYGPILEKSPQCPSTSRISGRTIWDLNEIPPLKGTLPEKNNLRFLRFIQMGLFKYDPLDIDHCFGQGILSLENIDHSPKPFQIPLITKKAQKTNINLVGFISI